MKYLWNKERADTQFSLYIRNRDKRCMNPSCQSGYSRSAPVEVLQCSHYWGRAILISRYDPDNCFSLCDGCHKMWENTKQGRYTEVMIRWLGAKRFNALRRRVEKYQHQNIPFITWNDAIKKCREFLTNKK